MADLKSIAGQLYVNSIAVSTEATTYTKTETYTKAESDASYAILSTLTKNTGTNGYQKLAGGTIIQWGASSVGQDSSTTFNFPIAFPTACRNIVLNANNANTVDRYDLAGQIVSASQGRGWATGGGTGFYWIAMGY